MLVPDIEVGRLTLINCGKYICDNEVSKLSRSYPILPYKFL